MGEELLSTSPVMSLAPWRSFVSGMTAGIAGATLGHPIDTIRVVMQTAPKDTAPTAMQCARNIYHRSGFTGLYAGLPPQLCTSVVMGSLLFGVYSGIKVRVVDKAKEYPQSSVAQEIAKNKVAAAGASGFATGALLSGLYTPLELIKCRQQTNCLGNTPFTMRNLIQQVQCCGPSALYKGFAATFVRQSVGNVFFFGTYEAGKSTIGTIEGVPSALLTLISGSIAGATFWTLVYPIDVVKSRVQVSNDNTSYRKVVTEILKSHGIRGFFRGFGATLFRSIPVNGASVVVYEYTTNALS